MQIALELAFVWYSYSDNVNLSDLRCRFVFVADKGNLTFVSSHVWNTRNNI